MTAKDSSVRVPCLVVKRGRRDIVAYPCRAGAHNTAEGSGETESLAKAQLVDSLLWVTHCDPTVVRDAAGWPWLIYPYGPRHNWVARRLTVEYRTNPIADGGAIHIPNMSSGSTTFAAHNFTQAAATVGKW
jgi:hypothetical protein